METLYSGIRTYHSHLLGSSESYLFLICSKAKNRRQAWWSLYLSEFNVKLIHQSGLKMIQSDALFRRPDFVLAKDTDNKNMTLLPENLFLNILDLTLQDRVLNLGQLDDFLRNFFIDDPPFGASDDWKLELVNGKNTLFYKGQNYVPDDLDLQHDIVKMLHDHETAGHPGESETLVSVKRLYW